MRRLFYILVYVIASAVAASSVYLIICQTDLLLRLVAQVEL